MVSLGYIVACGVLLGGCIVPVSLRQEEQPPNVRPSFVPELMDPPLNTQITPATSETAVQPHVVADDPNLDDQLTVRVFRVAGSNQPLIQLQGLETKLLPNDVEHPTYRSADLPSVPWCQSYFLGMTITVPITIVVADRDFSDKIGEQDQTVNNAGARGVGGWTLVCQP